jgi:hypothetical protein
MWLNLAKNDQKWNFFQFFEKVSFLTEFVWDVFHDLKNVKFKFFVNFCQFLLYFMNLKSHDVDSALYHF